MSFRPFELGKPVSRASDSDETPEDKFAFGVTAVKKGTVEGLSIPVIPKKSESDKEDETGKDQGQFEWGRPLLGGLSDEEDDGEDGVLFNEVSIPLQRSVRDIKKPDQEVIEEYVDEQGRRVKRISKVTSTSTVTRVERQDPTYELAVDVPTEPREEVEEYTDENGRRVRRVVRTSVTTNAKTVLRDGALKVVLKPGDHDRRELREGPDDVERIETFTSDHGYRTQKLTKAIFKTQLKKHTQEILPATVSKTDVPSPSSPTYPDEDEEMKVDKALEGDEPMDEDEDEVEVKEEDKGEYDEFNEEIAVVGIKRRPRVPKWFVVVPDEPEKPVKPESLTYPMKTPRVDPQTRQSPEIVEDISWVNIDRKVVIPELSTSIVDKKDEPQTKIFESAAPVYLDTDTEDVVPSVHTREVVLPEWMVETEATPQKPQQPEEEISWLVLPSQPQQPELKDLDRGDVKESVTATTLSREIVLPKIDGIEDESPEEVEEYVDENGVRVSRIIKQTRTTRTIKREGQQIEPMEVTFPVAKTQDDSPEEVEEFIDENGVRVRRMVKRTITTKTVIRKSVDDKPQTKVFESADPVYLKADSEDVVPSVQTREVVLPEWMVETEATPQGPKQSEEDISCLILSSQPQQPESKDDIYRDDVKESVTATTLNREIVLPEIDRMEDESPEEVEEYVDENGVRVRRIVKRTITTRTIKREGQRIEPVEVTFPVAQTQDESPEEVEEYVDENGVRVKRITKRTITTRAVIRKSVDDKLQTMVFESAAPVYLEADSKDVVPSLQTREVVLPEWMVETEATPQEPKQPEQDISWLILPSQPQQPELKDDLDRDDVKESVTATTLSRENVLPEFDEMEDESPEEREEYVDENGVRVRRIIKRTVTTKTVIRKSVDDKPQTMVFESATPVYLEADSEDVVPLVQTRDVVLPEWMVKTEATPPEPKQPEQEVSWLILPSQPQQPESKGDLDREFVKESVTATTLNREIVLPEIDGMESPEKVEEYVVENGVRVRRIVKRTITTRAIKREGQHIEPMEVTFPVAQTQDESPDEVEEYVDENGVRVRRIIKRTITTKTVVHKSVDDEPQKMVFDSAAPVYLEADSEDVVPSVQTRKVVLPEWMVETEATPEEPKQPEQDISWLILPSQPQQPESKEDLDRDDVKESVTATTLSREIVLPEIDGVEDELPLNVEEYVDENGVRVRRFVKRTITTRAIKREGQQIEPMEVTFPVAQTQDESPEEVEEYVDENGVRARIFKRTITTKTVVRKSVDDKPQTMVFESAAPVYLEADSENVVPSVQTREVALPEWMVETEATPPEPRQPEQEISWLILPSQPQQPESKRELDREDVNESVTATTLNREIVLPEIDGSESPEKVEEYVDENGVRVRRIVKRTITTRAIKREGQQIEPIEVTFPVAQTQDESPDEVEEYVDENGVRVRRIIKRTITTKTVVRKSVDDKPQTIVFESAAPVYLDTDTEDVVPSVHTREVVLPEWMVETEATPQKPQQPEEEISWLVLPSRPQQPELKDLDRGNVNESVTATTSSREIVLPEIDGVEDELPPNVEEYVDENGVRVRRFVKKTITTRTIKREGQQIEPIEVSFPVAQDDSSEEVQEYVDENGVQVRRIVKQTITTTSVHRIGVLESGVPVTMHEVGEEAVPSTETATLEPVTPEAVLLAHTAPLSPRRASMPYETTVVQRYLVIIETLYQYVLEHRSLIFIYSSRHTQFNFVLENFLYWMIVTLKKLSWMTPVSWKVDEIQNQLREIKVLTWSVFTFA